MLPPAPPRASSRPRGTSPALSALVALAAVLLFVLTGARDVLWGEPTKLALLLFDFDLDLAQWKHAGSLLLAWPFTQLGFLPFAQRVHLASAVMGGAAIGLVHATLLRVGVSPRGALAGVVAVACAHTIWMVSAMAENYAPVLLILSLSAWLAVARPGLIACGAVLGFGAVAHPICLFGVPALAFMVVRQRGVRATAGLAAGLAAGWLLPALWLARGSPLGGSGWGMVLERYADPALVPRNAALLGGLFAYNFAGPALVLLALGLRQLAPGARLSLLLFALAHYAVALAWIPQRALFIATPVYLAAAWPIALGAEAVLASGRASLRVLLLSLAVAPPCAYAVASVVARPWVSGLARDLAYRDESATFLTPWGPGAHSARAYIEDVGRVVEPDALLVGDFTLLTPLEYAQRVEGWRPDVTLFSVDHQSRAAIGAVLDRCLAEDRPVYLLEAELELGTQAAAERGALTPLSWMGGLQRLVPGPPGQAVASN
jgi:hypothetical protein